MGGKARPVAGYPSVTKAIIGLHDEGLPREEIMRRAETTLKMVQTTLAAHRASQSHAGAPPRYLPVLNRMRAQARARHMTTTELAIAILTTVADDDLYTAVLGE